MKSYCRGIFKNITALLFVITITGCSNLPPVDGGATKHFIAVEPDGELAAVRKPESKDIMKVENPDDLVDDETLYNNIIDGIKNHPRNSKGEIEVLIYVHGGLNSKKAAFDRVQSTYQTILDESDMYPVFVNWRTGPFSSYGSHLVKIRQGEVSETAPLTSPVYFVTDAIETVVNAPKSWIVNGRAALQSIRKSEVDESERRLLQYVEPHDNGNIFYENENTEISAIDGIKNFFAWWITSPVKAATTPIAYTMGRPTWDVMLRRTNTAFYTPSDLEPQELEAGYLLSNHGNGAFLRFLKKLSLAKNDENLPITVTLMGHSMGAIIINRVLALDLDLEVSNIVHLASADSIKNLLGTVAPYLIKNPTTDFYSLSLHPNNENRERSSLFRIPGLLPSGSLLNWIDNMYTTPETVIDKRSGSWSNIERTLALIPDRARKNMHFKIFGETPDFMVNDFVVSPQKHGDFGKMKFWDKSQWWSE